MSCRVCGLLQGDPPWGEDGSSPTFNICPCCGVEFGYEDSLVKGVHLYREAWLKKGAPWQKPKNRPQDWDLEAQLSQVPGEFKIPTNQ
jgi:hypothetical protein